MNLNIISEKENNLLQRKELALTIQYDKATPTRKEIREAVSSKLSANPETVFIRNITSKFGIKEIDALIHIYFSKEAGLKTEPWHILVRDNMAEKKPKKEKKKKAKAPIATKK